MVLWGLAIASSVAILVVESSRSRSTAIKHAAATESPPRYQEYSYTQIHMAMPVRISVFSRDEATAKTACRAGFQRIADLVKVFSDYDPNSEVNRLMDGKEPQPVSDDLLSVLRFAQQLHKQSSGAFDPTAGPCVKLWRIARKNGQLPRPSEIDAARNHMGFDKINVDLDRSSVSLPDGSSLDFGAIAKGYIGDETIKTVRTYGIESACFQAGGDFVLSNAPPGKPGWDVDIPFQGRRPMRNCAVSVSGDTSQFVEIDGVRYSHVVDPRTGQALTNRRMTVVTASCGLHSDAIATIGCILDTRAFNDLISQWPDVTAWQYSVTDDNQDSL